MLLTPIVPVPTGNGLAMRAGMQLEALNVSYDVRLVVIPVAGGTRDTGWAEQRALSVAIVAPGDPQALRAGTVELLSDAVWRDRLRASEPPPHAAALAGPGMARAVAAAAGEPRDSAVHAFRAYLAPLAVAVAERLGARSSTLDLDDDDEAAFEARGLEQEASAYRRLVATFGPAFAWLSLASPLEADAVRARHDLPTVVVPNAVDTDRGVGRAGRQGGVLRLLLVGNMTYEPNVRAAEVLAVEVLPRVRRLLPAEIRVELVGSFEPGGRVAALAAIPGVELSGYLDDLDGAYARADLVVAPLGEGGGTRIKILEAFAAGVPVVSTPAGVAGLGVADGREVLLGASPAELASAVARIATDEDLAIALAAGARALVVGQFSREVVGRRLRELMLEVAPAGG